MTIATQITQIKNDVTESYSRCQQAGGTIPSGYNKIANLANTIKTTATVGGLNLSNVLGVLNDATLSGPSISSWDSNDVKIIGDGVLDNSVAPQKLSPYLSSINLPNLTTVGNRGCYYFCNSDSTLQSVSMPKLTTVGANGMYGAFQKSKVKTADLSGLTIVSAADAFHFCFNEATELESINLNNLTEVSGESGMFSFLRLTTLNLTSLPNLTRVTAKYGMAFFIRGNTTITEFTFPKLQSVTGQGGLGQFFTDCTNLKKLYFPALTTVVDTAFGDAAANGMCNNCTALTEIHFKASVKSQVEATLPYANKFGATNATIYFDL